MDARHTSQGSGRHVYQKGYDEVVTWSQISAKFKISRNFRHLWNSKSLDHTGNDKSDKGQHTMKYTRNWQNEETAHDRRRWTRGKSEGKGYRDPPNLITGNPMGINSELMSRKRKRYRDVRWKGGRLDNAHQNRTRWEGGGDERE